MKTANSILLILFLLLASKGYSRTAQEYVDRGFAYVNFFTQDEISTPVNEYLMIDQNPDAPEIEFINGFNKVILTKGHPKSKGLDLQVRVPNSWSIQEGDRPNIIKKAVSQNGKGFEMVMLLVSDLGTTTISSTLFTSELMKQFIPKGGKYISGKKVTLDRIEGGMIEFEQIVTQIDIKLKVRGLFFIIPFKTKLVQIQCFTGGRENELNIEALSEKFRPLFRMIANSLVISNQYQ